MRDIDGILFYWVAWLSWIIATFHMKKSINRLLIAITLLMTIILSNTYVSWYKFTINLSMLFLMAIGCLIVAKSKLKHKAHTLILSAIIMMAYVSILVFQLYDPIWFFINKKYMVAIICSIIALFLSGSFKRSITAIFLGTNVGEIVFSLIIYKIHQTIFIQPHFVFDIIAISTAIVYVSHGYYRFVSAMQRLTTKSAKRGRAQL